MALVRPLSQVSSLVGLHLAFCRKSLSTNATGKGFHVDVSFLVNSELTLEIESLSTSFAAESSRYFHMVLFVYSQIALGRKGLSTMCALVELSLLSDVSTLVAGEEELSIKRAATSFTLVLFSCHPRLLSRWSSGCHGYRHVLQSRRIKSESTKEEGIC